MGLDDKNIDEINSHLHLRASFPVLLGTWIVDFNYWKDRLASTCLVRGDAGCG